MINGVLVERTVKDVVPALKTNAEGLKKVLDDLVKQYKTKQDDLEKWKARHDFAALLPAHITNSFTEEKQCPSRAVLALSLKRNGHDRGLRAMSSTSGGYLVA